MLAAILATGLAGAADAACTRADFAGNWIVKSSTGHICTAKIAKTGKMSASTCVLRGARVGTISGTLTISASCVVGGTIKQTFKTARDSFRIAGRMAPSKASFTGVGETKSGVLKFRAVRQ